MKTMTGNDHVQILPSSSPAGLLPLLVVFGSVLIGPWSPIAAAQMGPDRKEKAVLDIVVLQRRNGTLVLSDTVQLTGVFSSAGTIEYAKGYLRQIHTCADESDSLWTELEYNWMAVFKLLEPQDENQSPFCAHPYDKAKLAISKGAKAVIVDVRDNEAAARQLRRSRSTLSQPVIIVRGKDAGHLRRILLWEVEAVGHIKTVTEDQEVTVVNKQNNDKDYYNMAIFLGVLIVFSTISIVVILQLRRKWKRREESVTEKTKQVLKKMGTRRYRSTIDAWREHSSDACAICLEEYSTSQELRVLPCSHEFHKECIDPWLLNNPTCPLCLYNIIECPASSKAGSTCASGELVEQFDPAPAPDMEMAPYGSRYAIRPRTSFPQRTCFLNQIRCTGADVSGLPRPYDNPQNGNEAFEGLLQTYEADRRAQRPEPARRNSLNFCELGRKTRPVMSYHLPLRVPQRTRSRKHAKSRPRRCGHRQAPCLVSTLSSKVSVFAGDDSSPNRVLPYACGGELSYSSNGEPAYACRTRPSFSFSGRSDADVSNFSADDERSQFCQNYSLDGGTTSCSVRGSDVVLGDVHSFSSQTTNWSFEAKFVPPILTSFQNSPLSSLPNTRLSQRSADFTAFDLARCQASSAPTRRGLDLVPCESLESLPLPSSDATSLCKVHRYNTHSRLASLPQIDVLCHSPGFHKRSFSSARCLNRLDVTNDDGSNITDCDSSASYLCPDNIQLDNELSLLSASPHAGLDCICENSRQMAETRNLARRHLTPFWDKSSEHSLQLSMLSLCDSHSSFSS